MKTATTNCSAADVKIKSHHKWTQVGRRTTVHQPRWSQNGIYKHGMTVNGSFAPCTHSFEGTSKSHGRSRFALAMSPSSFGCFYPSENECVEQTGERQLSLPVLISLIYFYMLCSYTAFLQRSVQSTHPALPRNPPPTPPPRRPVDSKCCVLRGPDQPEQAVSLRAPAHLLVDGRDAAAHVGQQFGPGGGHIWGHHLRKRLPEHLQDHAAEDLRQEKCDVNLAAQRGLASMHIEKTYFSSCPYKKCSACEAFEATHSERREW